MDAFDATTGRVWISVYIAVDATSARPKHTDPVEQGGWLFLAASNAIRTLEASGVEGAAVLSVNYHGSDPGQEPTHTA